ncbi:MAG: type VII toxin-antitoxin system HepT family RNase toxin [Acidimicrobiales bacterium]
MVDQRRVRRLLQRVSEDLDYLRQRAALDPTELLGDADRLAGLKYVFVTAIEGCLNVAQHLCASEGWGPPESNAEALRLLGSHGVLAGPLAEEMARAVGFRNVLVHGYVGVDDQLVVAFLTRLPVFDDFVAAVAGLLVADEG